MDNYACASLAHVRILLLPVGVIQQSTFEKYAREIRSFEDIRLGDIPADHKDERARFMPNPLSAGYLHLSFPSHPPPSSHTPLSLLRPSHFPLAVIGVANCSQTDSLSSLLAQFNSSLLEIFPSGCMYPLAKNCFVFEDGDSNTNLNLGDNIPGLVVIPSMMGNKKLYIGTLLADLCSHILGEFGVMVQALESPLGNEYLNSTLMPVLPPLSEIPTPLEKSSKLDFLPPLPSHNSQPDMAKSGPTLGSTQYLKRNSSLGPNVRQSSLGVPGPKKRLSGIGVASSHGRLFKVLGDFFLLAGRSEDALVWYTEAIVLFKSPLDSIWHASALEGIATVSILDAWNTGHGLNASTVAMKEPWIDISDKLIQAATMYYRSPMLDTEHYPLLTYLYCCAILRQASLLFSIWSAKGWGPLAFTTMLQPGPKPYLPPTLSHNEPHSSLNLERLSSISGISRYSIATVLAQIHGPWLLHLDAAVRVSVLENVARLYGYLGYKRKEAYILREVLGCILDLIVCGREEDGHLKKSSVPGSAGLGIPGINFSGLQNTAHGNVGVRLVESAEGNESILKLLKYVCNILGNNLEAVRLIDVESDRNSQQIDEVELARAVSDYDEDAFEELREPRGWPELQVGVVREAVAVAEALPDYPAVAQFALSSLKTLRSVLTPADQQHFASTAARALITARRRGDTKHVDYWAGRPIVSISISPLPLVRVPIEKPVSALASLPEINPVLAGGTDPFLYNPRRAQAGLGKTLVVQNETLEFVVVLQNPYVIDLELQSVTLSTSGVAFESKSMVVVIPARSYHPVTLVGKAVESGTLVIRGCVVRASGGASREFVLPLATDEEEERLSRKRSALACEAGRSKYAGLNFPSWKTIENRISTSLAVPKSFPFLELRVVPEQPLLRIRRTSLTHGAVMLYDGEMSVIRITLENVSHLPIDFLRLAFDDSTIAPAQQALADGELSVFETYETEYDLIHRPMFTWNSQKEPKEVAPGQKVTLIVTCFGKVGCTNGIIHFSYSYIHRPQDKSLTQPADVFHTRQLSYPVMVTVYHMLECHRMDILPFSYVAPRFDEDPDIHTQPRESILLVGDEAGWCLFSVEVRNTYGLPFDVTFERDQEGTPPVTSSCTVAPGSTCRIIIPVKKFLLSEDQVSKPIPTLSDRQFVITKSKLTTIEERAQRELFWYREELLKYIRGYWRETGGIRSGNLSLRQQRMTLHMLKSLRTETARIQMSLIQYSATDAPDPIERPSAMSGAKYLAPPNEFVYLRTKISNMSPSPLVLTLDLSLEPEEYVIYEGVLSDQPIGRLESGESRELEMALCFLSYGRFLITAQARIIGLSRTESEVGCGQLAVVV